MLDIEYNPYGADLLRPEPGQHAQLDHRRSSTSTTPRPAAGPVIYTTTDWWTHLHRQHAGFAANDPLWIARYSTSAGTLPAGWGFYTIWQYADSGIFPGDQDVFNGDYSRLQALANG